jgi:hypothetical protein
VLGPVVQCLHLASCHSHAHVLCQGTMTALTRRVRALMLCVLMCCVRCLSILPPHTHTHAGDEVLRAERGLLFVGVICCYNLGSPKTSSYVTVSVGPDDYSVTLGRMGLNRGAYLSISVKPAPFGIVLHGSAKSSTHCRSQLALGDATWFLDSKQTLSVDTHARSLVGVEGLRAGGAKRLA